MVPYSYHLKTCSMREANGEKSSCCSVCGKKKKSRCFKSAGPKEDPRSQQSPTPLNVWKMETKSFESSDQNLGYNKWFCSEFKRWMHLLLFLLLLMVSLHFFVSEKNHESNIGTQKIVSVKLLLSVQLSWIKFILLSSLTTCYIWMFFLCTPPDT